MNLQRFKTLLLREWMQHRFGWLMVMVLPPLLVMALLPFGTPGPEDAKDISSHGADILAFGAMSLTALGVFAMSWCVNMFSLSGLARRDNQDRSIEFWLSLPATHVESIGAPVLMSTLLIPMLALCVGGAIGVLMSAAVIVKVVGLGGLAQVQWGTVWGMGLVGLARVLLGTVLMTLWLAPISLALMAASAWLKRWGAPLLIGGTLVGGAILKKVYGTGIVFELLTAQLNDAGYAFLRMDKTTGAVAPEQLMNLSVSEFAQQMLTNLQDVLAQMAAPHFVGGLLIAAACFWLLMLKRSRPA